MRRYLGLFERHFYESVRPRRTASFHSPSRKSSIRCRYRSILQIAERNRRIFHRTSRKTGGNKIPLFVRAVRRTSGTVPFCRREYFGFYFRLSISASSSHPPPPPSTPSLASSRSHVSRIETNDNLRGLRSSNSNSSSSSGREKIPRPKDSIILSWRDPRLRHRNTLTDSTVVSSSLSQQLFFFFFFFFFFLFERKDPWMREWFPCFERIISIREGREERDEEEKHADRWIG